MTEKEIWGMLSGIPVGTVLAWISIAVGIVASLSGTVAMLWKLFKKYDEIMDQNVKLRNKIEETDAHFKEIDEQLAAVKVLLEEQRSTKIKELRNAITNIAETALRDGKMSVRAYKSLLEMYQEYTDIYHQNSFVSSLMDKVVRDVEIIGALDEHGNDI